MLRMILIVTVTFILFALAKEATSAEVNPEWSIVDGGAGCVMTFAPASTPGYAFSVVYVDGTTILGFTAPSAVYPPTEKIKNVRIVLSDASELVPEQTLRFISPEGTQHISLQFAGDISSRLSKVSQLMLYLESDVELPTAGVYRFGWNPTTLWNNFSVCISGHRI